MHTTAAPTTPWTDKRLHMHTTQQLNMFTTFFLLGTDATALWYALLCWL